MELLLFDNFFGVGCVTGLLKTALHSIHHRRVRSPEVHRKGSEGGPRGRRAHRHHLRPGVLGPELRSRQEDLRHQGAKRAEAARHLCWRDSGYL